MIDVNKLTKKELKLATQAVECSTYLMQYCGVNRYGNNCEKCIFNTADGCAIKGAPYEYKALKDQKEG